MTIATVGDNLQTALQTINSDSTLTNEADVRVFRNPPEQISALPCIVFWINSGFSNLSGANDMTQFYTWHVDFLTSRQSIQHAAERAEKYIQPLINTLWNDIRLSDSIAHIGQGNGVTYEAVAYEYSGKPVFGYRFVVEMKQRETLS